MRRVRGPAAGAALGLAVLLLALPVAAKDLLVGAWQGRWTRGAEQLDLAMDIRPGDADNRYVATLSSRGMRLEAVPLASALHDGCCGIRLVLRGDAAATHFRATIQGGELRGTSAEDNGPRGTFVLHRVSQAREEAR